jgi:hypothetical protein
MRTLRIWILCLLMPLLAPLAWGGVVQAAPADAARQELSPEQAASPPQAALPCHTANPGVQQASTTDAQGAPAHQHLGCCGDCSACHALALLPPNWQLNGPALVQAAPGWHAATGRGRPKTCELYRPPRA